MELRNKLAIKVQQAKHNYFTFSLPEFLRTDPSKFWRYLGKTNESVRKISVNNHLVDNAADIAHAFNVYFHSVFYPNGNYSIHKELSKTDIPVITSEGVISMLRKLNEKKSAGKDGIPTAFLKRFAEQIADYLANLFQLSLTTSEFPDDWKIARVVPIFKKGDKLNITNYRPVSMISTCSKLMEHVIAGYIRSFLSNNKILSPYQHGFTKGRSTTTQLLTTVHDFMMTLDHSGQIDAFFIDFIKAFDKVPHTKLIHKLKLTGLPCYLVKWVEAYLHSRKQFVVVDECASDLLPVSSGVPQGSVLGPLLFLVYVNDLIEFLSDTVCIKLFADDCTIYKEILCESDHVVLQEQLFQIEQWCPTSDIEINVQKTVLLTVTRKLQPSSYSYTLCNQAIAKGTSYKYLGVKITSKLSWSGDVSDICA